jgi:hypothetical protein
LCINQVFGAVAKKIVFELCVQPRRLSWGGVFFGLGRENVEGGGVLFELCIARFFGLMEGGLGHILGYIIVIECMHFCW